MRAGFFAPANGSGSARLGWRRGLGDDGRGLAGDTPCALTGEDFMAANPVEQLIEKRASRWRRWLQPPLPVYHNPVERDFQPELGRWNLYIAGAGSVVDGYVNVDLCMVPGVTVVCSAEQLPFRDDLFQRVECDAVLEHTRSPQRMISEIYRCTRPGGHVHLVVPFCHPFHEYPRDYYRFPPDGLKEIAKPFDPLLWGWRSGPTATLLAFLLEYVKIWFPGRTLKRVAYVLAGWLLFPFRYLDWFFYQTGQTTALGNHCYLWARKPGAD